MIDKDTLNWVLKNIVVPLTPFFIGAGLRFIYTRTFSMELFNESELALSMGLLCIIMIKSANKITDETLGDNISYVLMILTLCFIVFFACSSFLQFHIDIKATNQINKIVELLIQNKFDLKVDQIYTPQKDDFFGMLGAFRIGTFLLTLITIPTVITFKNKYNLT